MKTCREIRRQMRSGTGLDRDDEQHLFVCPACRRRSRAERAERELEGLATLARPEAAVSPDFVARVMRGLPLSAETLTRRPAGLWKWAAALAFFSAAAGYGYAVGSDTAAAGQQVAAVSSLPGDEIAALSF